MIFSEVCDSEKNPEPRELNIINQSVQMVYLFNRTICVLYLNNNSNKYTLINLSTAPSDHIYSQVMINYNKYVMNSPIGKY